MAAAAQEPKARRALVRRFRSAGQRHLLSYFAAQGSETQLELATRVGVDRRALARIANGETRPSAETMFALEDARIGVRVDMFRLDSEQTFPKGTLVPQPHGKEDE